jgi:hypothetical protein
MEGTRTISRRRALKFFGLVSSTAAGQNFLAAWWAGPPTRLSHTSCSDRHDDEPTAKPYVPQFFKPQEFRAIEVLTETIIPADGTPGAQDARVAEYIDFVVFSAAEFQPSLQAEWRGGLADLERFCQEKFGRTFPEASEEQRNQLLTQMSVPERDPGAKHDGFAFFTLAKEMTVEAFYTSKIGLIDVLDYKGMNYNEDFPGCTHPEHQS